MLDIRDLHLTFHDHGAANEVLHGINLHMDAGERLGLVGESGSGKSVTALSVAGLLRRSGATVSGEICFEGRNLLALPREEMRKIQGKEIGMIFQEPMTSLNPLMKVGRQIEEVLRIHTDKSPAEMKALALEVMEKVGLPDPPATYEKYPHQLSGGQRQRAMIAAAFIIDPKLLLCDEPTTALDVTVQAQIIELLKRINVNRGIGLLFISHDLHIIRKLCNRVAVMYQGRIVETGPTEEVFRAPQDEYTKRLIAAIPTREKRKRTHG
jgi:ABC-type dipeptide/oligopeptide/nickel transport system ATPase component